MDTNETIAIVFGFAFLITVIPIIGGLMYARRERLLTHAERMKALELGAPLPDDAATARVRASSGQSAAANDGDRGSLARKCYSTAVWVAFWGFAAAAGLGGAAVSAGVAYAIAASAAAIGVTSVICGTILASRASVANLADDYGKPATDDVDAFDVVSCRG
jgi:hypothetical protein